ncbi:MAG: hypothetical protein WCC78_16205, partial [Terriglobales bacterium]
MRKIEEVFHVKHYVSRETLYVHIRLTVGKAFNRCGLFFAQLNGATDRRRRCRRRRDKTGFFLPFCSIFLL